MLTSLSLAYKARIIGPKQHGYMLPMLDDASHQELVISAACAGERDRNEKGVKFRIFILALPIRAMQASQPPRSVELLLSYEVPFGGVKKVEIAPFVPVSLHSQDSCEHAQHSNGEQSL